MAEHPLPGPIEFGLNIVARIMDGIPRDPVADLQKHDCRIGAILKLMRLAAGRKAGTHAGREKRFATLGHERRRAFQHINKLILTTVAVA